MKNIVLGVWLFFLSIFLVDCLLSFFLEKEVYQLVQKKINIIPWEKSLKQVSWADWVYSHWSIPMWSVKYRWPFFYKSHGEKTQKCRLLWIGDSIMYGSWVFSNQTYMFFMSKAFKNTEVINLAVPWYDALQEIVTLEKTNLLDTTDVLVWHFWEDDGNVYSLVNGVLYDTRVILNDVWLPQLYYVIPTKINDFLIEYSYLYNEVLKIKMNKSLAMEITGNDLMIIQLEEFLIHFHSNFPNTKIVVLFSPSLKNDWYTFEYRKTEIEPQLYQRIRAVFQKYSNVYLVNIRDFLQWISVKDVRYDTCCHFEEYGHKKISEGLIEFIKSKQILDETCF